MDSLDPFDPLDPFGIARPLRPAGPSNSHHGAAEPVRLVGPAAEQPIPAADTWDDEPAAAGPASALENALAMIGLGCKLVPVQAGSKAPIGRGWQNDATDDGERVCAWLEAGHFYGVAGGHELSPGRFLVIVDLDVKHGLDGPGELATLATTYGPLPETFTVATPSGGRHLYFATDFAATNSPGRMPPGIDIRGKGGQCVGPGCVGSGGQPYRVISAAPIADAPTWLAAMLRAAGDRRDADRTPASPLDQPEDIAWARHYLVHDARPAVLGRGNNTVYEVACCLAEHGLDEKTAADLMWDLYNPRCEPPWGANEAETFETPIRSAYRNSQNRPASKSTAVVAEGFGDAVTIEPGPAEGSAERQAMNAASEERDREDRLARIRAALVRAEPGFAHHKAVPCVVEGLAWRGEVTIFWGPGSAGKSLFAEAMLPAYAAAGKTLGKFRFPKPIKTLVLNTEDTESETLSRALACAEANGIDAETVRDGLLVMKRDLAIEFSVADYGSFKSLRVNDRGIGDLAALAREMGVGLIVLDPLSNLHGLDDNSVADMSVVLKAVRRLAREADAAVILLLHTNKAGLDRPGDPSAMGGSGKLTTGVRKTVSFFPARAGGKKHDEHPNSDGEDAAGRFPTNLGKAEARTWVRMDDAKTNRGFGATTWLRIGGAGLPVLNEFGEPVTVPVMTLAYDQADSTAGARGSSTVDPAREFQALDDTDYAAFAAGFTDDDILNAMGALGSHWRREQMPGARGPAPDPADLAHTMVAAGCGWPLEAAESERRARAMLRHLVDTGRAELREMNATGRDGRKRLGAARSIRIVPAQERDKAVTPAKRVREMIKRGSQTQDGTWLFDDGRSPRSIDLPFAIGFGIVSGDKFTRNGNAGTLTESEARQARFHVDTWIAEGRIVLSEEERAGVHYTIAQLSDGEAKQ